MASDVIRLEEKGTMLVAALAAILVTAAAEETAAPVRAARHLELRLSDWRGFGEGAFFVDIVPAGEVTRKGDAPLGPKHLGPEVRESLRVLLTREKFFDLKEEYGSAVIEGRARRVTARLDGRYHSVTVNDLSKADKPVGEIGRALRVWYGALRALSDPGTIQVEPQDRFFLDPR